MDTQFVLAQIFGFVALVIVLLSYFRKTKTEFLLNYVFANIFYALAFFMLSATVAGLLTLISILRSIAFYFCQKKNFKYSFIVLILFLLFYLAVTIVFFQNWTDIVPLITSSLFTIIFYIKNIRLTRYLMILPNIILVIYNIYVMTYTNAALDFLEIIVAIVSIVSFEIINKKNKSKE